MTPESLPFVSPMNSRLLPINWSTLIFKWEKKLLFQEPLITWQLWQKWSSRLQPYMRVSIQLSIIKLIIDWMKQKEGRGQRTWIPESCGGQSLRHSLLLLLESDKFSSSRTSLQTRRELSVVTLLFSVCVEEGSYSRLYYYFPND